MTSEREYNALPGLRWSVLSGMRTSPAKCAYDRARAWEPASGFRAIGIGVHSLVLTPATADQSVAIYDGPVRRGKAWDAFVAAHTDESILTAPEWDTARALAAALSKHPVAGPLLASLTEQESAITWDDGGVSCKARIDGMARWQSALVDVKTTRRDNPRDFARDAASYGYLEQLAFYSRGLRATGRPPREHRLIVACTEEPYPIGVFDVDSTLMSAADIEVARLLGMYRDCERSGRWPSWGDDGVISLGDHWPKWAELGNDSALTIDGEAVDG